MLGNRGAVVAPILSPLHAGNSGGSLLVSSSTEHCESSLWRLSKGETGGEGGSPFAELRMLLPRELTVRRLMVQSSAGAGVASIARSAGDLEKLSERFISGGESSEETEKRESGLEGVAVVCCTAIVAAGREIGGRDEKWAVSPVLLAA